MRALIQLVSEASVTVDGTVKGEIGQGLLILLGVEEADTQEDIDWLAGKIARLRIFDDGHGHMNKSVQEVNGGLLVISQFTLLASTKKGNRPGFTRAARPETAVPLYEQFVKKLSFEAARPVETGDFGADMKVRLLNDGPVTIWMDTKEKE
jgi:D-tyrosyl-tRNA(Tyr) deacylase